MKTPDPIGRKHGELLNHSLYKVTWWPENQKKKNQFYLPTEKLKKVFTVVKIEGSNTKNNRNNKMHARRQIVPCIIGTMPFQAITFNMSLVGRKRFKSCFFFCKKGSFSVFFWCVFCLFVSLHLDHIQNNKFLE